MDKVAKRRLARINAKGLAVADRLADLLAAKNVTLAEMGDLNDLGLADLKEIRLRSFLDRINAARVRLTTAEYGRCSECGIRFQEAVLDETPWIEQCTECNVERPEKQEL